MRNFVFNRNKNDEGKFRGSALLVSLEIDCFHHLWIYMQIYENYVPPLLCIENTVFI